MEVSLLALDAHDYFRTFGHFRENLGSTAAFWAKTALYVTFLKVLNRRPNATQRTHRNVFCFLLPAMHAEKGKPDTAHTTPGQWIGLELHVTRRVSHSKGHQGGGFDTGGTYRTGVPGA